MKNLRLTAAVAAIGLVGVVASPAFAQDISSSPHNMQNNAALGYTDVNNESNGEICVFCHTPHGANTGVTAPLWNRIDSSLVFTTYDSASIDGEVLAVGSVSMACLSCHDGASNIDVVINAPGSTTTGGTNNGPLDGQLGDGFVLTGFRAIGENNAATGLLNDHPIGVQYGADTDFNLHDTDGTYAWVEPASADNDIRDKTDMILYNRDFATGLDFSVECGSCHDPHNTSTATVGGGLAESNQVNFLRTTNAGSALCLTCHDK